MKRRHYERIVINIDAVLVMDNDKIPVRVIDISKHGIRLMVSGTEDIESEKIEGLIVENVSIDNSSHENIRVVWSQDEGEKTLYGIQIMSVEKAIENQLSDLVERIIQKKKMLNARAERVPHDHRRNHQEDFVKERRKWLSEKTGVKLPNIAYYPFNSEDVKGNTENFIGVVHVPIGIVGPLKINGDFAKGIFYVPFATTEGALVETYQRGAIAISQSEGVNVFINKDENHLDPIFLFKNNEEARHFIEWISKNFIRIKMAAETTTGFGKLLRVDSYLMGRRVILDCVYHTSDAMGANMIGIATEALCEFIEKETVNEGYLLRSNFSSEKKASGVNLIHGYGKEVSAEVVIPRKIVKRFLFTTPEKIADSWDSWALSSFCSGMYGMNAHFANGVAAIFIACGQDPAHVSNASVGILSYELTGEGDLYTSLKLPNIIVGTIGGGTALASQKECLTMLDCYGPDKSKKFAEIIGATLIAGEIGICAGITTKKFLDPHKRAREYTRKKAFDS